MKGKTQKVFTSSGRSSLRFKAINYGYSCYFSGIFQCERKLCRLFRVIVLQKFLYKSVTIIFYLVIGENKIIPMQQFSKICDQESSQHSIVKIVFVFFLFWFLRPTHAPEDVIQISTYDY